MYLFNGWHRCMNQNLIWSNSIVTLEIYFSTKKKLCLETVVVYAKKKILIERRNGDIFPMLKNKMFWWVFIFRLESFTSKINRIWLKCCRQFGFFVSFHFTIFGLFFSVLKESTRKFEWVYTLLSIMSLIPYWSYDLVI